MEIKKPSSHIDEMLRQTRLHHVQLSSMADVKANMLLTMSSVLITLAAPQLGKSNLKLAFIVLIGFCLLTIILAAYSTLPKLNRNSNKEKSPNINSSKFNLLFFGDFSQLNYDQYQEAMSDIMNDPNRTYEAQVRELYILGKYLATKKYFSLRLAYLAFLIGLVLCGLIIIFTEFSFI